MNKLAVYSTGASSHSELINSLRSNAVIKSPLVFETLLAIDRKFFVPHEPYYNDSPSGIGFGATISAPHMHAFALEYLEKDIVNAKNILDVGSGTGILTLAMAIMAKKDATVYGIEHVPELTKISIENISKCQKKILDEKIKIITGDGRQGWPDKSVKFDVIHVGAAPEKIPEGLIEQLAEGGVMVIPVGKENRSQEFLRVEKNNGTITTKNLLNVRYVPLTDLKYQLE